jgi:hypothetical protein
VEDAVKWQRLVAILGVLALLGGGCLGSLRRDPAAEAVTMAPRDVLRLPVHESRPYWLLRAEPGWDSAHEVRFGGDPGDPAVFIVRVVRFHDEGAAIRAFARLTPGYIYLAFRDRMTDPPHPFDYPLPLPGDEVMVTEYSVRLPGDIAREATLIGQMTAIRSGAVVLLIESIGVVPEQFSAAVLELTSAVGRVTNAGR